MPSAFLRGSDYLALPRDPQPWIIKDLITIGGLTNIFGKPKTGKSYAALGMAHAISTGQDEWLGFPVKKHGPVAYFQIDTPRGEWADRVDRVTEAGYDLDNVWFCDMLVLPQYPYNILDPAQQKWLHDQLADLNPVLVIIDTLREAHNGDENDSTAMRNVVTSIVAACRPAAIVLLSHARKEGIMHSVGGDDLMSDARGSSYISGRMDTVIKFTATAMQYKGRSKGEGRITVEQNDETGLIQFDATAEAYMLLLRKRVLELREEDPTISVNAMAVILAKETDYKKKRSIDDDIKELLMKLNMDVRVKKSGKAKTSVGKVNGES